MNTSKVRSGKWTVGSGPCDAASVAIHPSSFILHPSFRRGISLLEVLISIGVLAVGLLSVLMVIPLGSLTIQESVKADRTGACGRAIERQIKVKRMLDFRSWEWEPANNSNPGIWGWGWLDVPDPPTNPTQVKRTRMEIKDPDTGVTINNVFMQNINFPDALCSFVVDPFGRNPPSGLPPLPDVFYLPPGYEKSNTSLVWTYPLNNVPPSWTTPLPVLPRRTLSPAYLQMAASALPLPRTPINGTTFIWPDDLALDTPENAVERPFINSSGLDNSRSWDYSYLFTVTPSSSERDQVTPLRRFFDVTVVVFFQRLFTTTNGFPDGEWMADVRDISGMPAGSVSPGGGTIQLGNAYRVGGSVLTTPQSMPLSNPLPFVREGQWVMLWDCGNWVPGGSGAGPMGNYTNGRLAWYRVVGVNFPEATSGDFPTLTLDGPDWIVTPTTKLLVIDGAIGAYTSTVELDYDPLWQGMK